MARGRQKDEWSRTSWLLSKIHNAWHEKKAMPNDFNPFETPTRRRKPKTRISDPRLLGFGTVCEVH
ncbi:MAG: hypothetical protein HY290_33510 [Planctomycetia bacterium]|nr:hypothetical protein [Planctomycetia bacterium]